MYKKIMKYWKEAVFFASYLGVILYCSPLDYTQIGGGDTVYAFMYGAEYWGIARPPASFFYSIGWLATRLPVNTGLSFVLFTTVFPAVGSAILIYIITKKHTSSALAPWIASAVLMSSWIYFMEATKSDYYIFVSFLLLLGYALTLHRKWKIAVLAFAAALCSHVVVAGVVITAMFIHETRARKPLFVGGLLALICLYLWNTYSVEFSPDVGKSIPVFLFSPTFKTLFRSGYMAEVPSNAVHALFFVPFMLSFGLIPIVRAVVKEKLSSRVVSLSFLFVVTMLMSIVSDPAWRAQLVAAGIPFMAILAGIGVEYVGSIFVRKMVLVGSLVIMLFVFPFVFSAEEPTSVRGVLNQLGSIPEDSIIMCWREYNGGGDHFSGHGMEMAMMYYIRKTGRNLSYVSIHSMYSSTSFRKDNLLKEGVVFPEKPEWWIPAVEKEARDYNLWLATEYMTELNPDREVYYFSLTDAKGMECELKQLK